MPKLSHVIFLEKTACKADQIYKMTTIFTQNGPTLSFLVFILSCLQFSV